MKSPHPNSYKYLALTFFAASVAPLIADSFTLYIEDSVPDQRREWFEDSIWLEGFAPIDGSDVEMPMQFDAESSFAYTYVELRNTPVILNSLIVDDQVDLQVSQTNFTVTGDYSGGGFISAQNATVSLGTNLNYLPLSKTLDQGSYLIWESDPPHQSIMEWGGADIETNKAYLLFWGTNAVLRDKNNPTHNAMENFSRNEGTLVLEDGYVMNIKNNFTNTLNGQVRMNFNTWTRDPVLHIAGNLINEGSIELLGNSILTVNGGYSGSGTISSYGSQNQISVLGAYVQNGGTITVKNGNEMTVGGDMTLTDTLIINKGNGTKIEVTGDILMTGGKVDTGPSGVDSFVLKARAGVYQNNATISGEGKLIMNVSVNNSYITPGNTPGKLNIEGNLSITGTSELEIELGGTLAGDSYDVLAQSGGTTGTSLGGMLKVKLVDHFECALTGSHTFTVVTSDKELSGFFTNVANGARLATTDGLGTFLVSYGTGSSNPKAVVLSDFIANAVAPQTFEEWAIAKNLPPGLDGPLADADGNGVKNLLEYAFGHATGACQAKTKIVGENFVFTYSVPKSVTGLNITSHVSSTLENGSWAVGPTPQAAGTTAANLLYTVTIPYVPATPQFIYLAVDLPAN